MASTVEGKKRNGAPLEQSPAEPSSQLPAQQPPRKVYKSALSAPDDDLWLEYGRKMITESATAIRNAATALMTGLGTLQAIYIGVLGFAKFIPEDIVLWKKFLFVIPLFLWMFALYQCMQVLMTDLAKIYHHSPDNIRRDYEKWVNEKQRLLRLGFWCMFWGLVAAMALIILRLKL
jgi:hypothetical protein